MTAQIALALALLVPAGFFIGDYLYRLHAGFGIDPRKVLTANVRLSDLRYEDPARQAEFFQNALERLQAAPGVVSAGATTSLVHLQSARSVTFHIAGQAAVPRTERPRADYSVISPRFLEALRVPLVRGRDFEGGDTAGTRPVVLVNQAFVRRYFSHEDPLGKHIRLDTGDEERRDGSEIVGVVGTIRDLTEQWEERAHVYESYLQRPSAAMSLVLRTATDPAAAAPALRGAIRSIDQEQPVHGVQTMEQVIADSRAGGVLLTSLLGSYAGLAMAMAIVGVFGVMAYTVAQRTREIGIRMALGARPRDVLRMTLGRGCALGAMGVGSGLVLTAPLVWLREAYFGGMPFTQRVAVVLGAGLLLWVAALLASYVPARRATKVDVIVALRYE